MRFTSLLIAVGFASMVYAQAVPVDQALPPDPVGAELAKALLAANIPPMANQAADLPKSLPMNQSAWINTQNDSRAVRLTVYSAALRSQYGPATAAGGQAMLVLDTELQNLIPYTLIAQRQIPTEYQIPNLADHLYVVVNGRFVGRLHPDAKNLPGHQPVRDFKLERVGSASRANAVFVLPAVEIKTLELRHYDFAHGHVMLPLIGGESPVEKPLATPVRNEVVEAAVFGVEKSPKIGDRAAPPGMQFVQIDLRAASRFMLQADATAFAPKASPGQKMQIGTVADWTDSRKYLQLVVDGERGYAPVADLTTLHEQPRFLPDLMTGGTVTFLAPLETKSIQLRCDFPNAKTSDGQTMRPRGFTLAVEGKEPSLATIKPLAKIDDEPFTLNWVNQSTPATFAGKAPEVGKRWLVLDFVVSVRGNAGEMFQTNEQLKIVTSKGEQSPPDKATYDGVYQPSPLLWIPAGERRAFAVAYQFPVDDVEPRLMYGGVTKAETVALVRLAPGAEASTRGAEAGRAEVITEQPKAQDVATNVQPRQPAKADLPPLDVNGRKFPPRVPIKPNLKAKGLEGVGLTPEQVNAMIDRGAEFLWAELQKDDEQRQQVGERQEHTIIALALVHCDFHKKNKAFDTALRAWLSKYQPNKRAGTYEVGIMAMLIEAYGDPTFLPQLRACAKWLVESQGKDGSWGYGRTIDNKLFEQPDDGRVLKVEGGRPLDQADQVTRTLPAKVEFDGDTSVTQYALLGLNSVERAGVKVPADVWEKALAVHRYRQTKADGGWGYHSPGGSYGSMTAAGICGIALTQHSLNQPIDEAVVERGLAWLNANFSVEKHPGSEDWLYYYLYSLERVGRILDTEFIGEHEWYPLGIKYLHAHQEKDGGWTDKHRPNERDIASSFALLFATRATPSLKAAERKGPGVLKTAVLLPPGKKLYIILDASGSMLTEMDGQQKFEIARSAVSALIKELPANAEVGLRAYGYRRRAIEKDADEDTNLLVPIGPLKETRAKLTEVMAGIRARGKTPMALSLEQARKDLPAGTEESPVTVLLLTDGGEDTQPRRDPIAAARAFADLPFVKVRIVGFDINREDWNEQLQAMAKASNGQYLPAGKADALLRELRTAVFETPDQFMLFSEAGKELASGNFGDSMQLPPGKYKLRATYAGRTFEQDVWVNPGATTAVTFQSANVKPGQLPGEVSAEAVKPATPTEQPKGKFCTSCGNALAATAKFCAGCGAKVP